MTQRTILADQQPTVIIKAGSSVTVRGYDSNQVSVTSKDRWGVQVERKSDAEFARARAAIGETVLFDIRLNKPNWGEKKAGMEIIEVQLGGSGEVLVPFESTIKVYAGKDISVYGVHGRVDAFSGLNLILQDVYQVGNASAGWTMNLDCQTMAYPVAEFTAGRDLVFHIQDLTSAFFRVKDIGGYWEARIGDGERKIILKCGGDVTLVTDQKVEALPPNYILGRIERPAENQAQD